MLVDIDAHQKLVAVAAERSSLGLIRKDIGLMSKQEVRHYALYIYPSAFFT